jgi:hypothetical protein
MPDDIRVICVNDGTSFLTHSVDHAKANGWLVYSNPSAEQIAQGLRMGMCPSCEEDADASGAYV